MHPVQVFLDLLTHPERVREAAEQVRPENPGGWRFRGARGLLDPGGGQKRVVLLGEPPDPPVIILR